MRVKDQYSIEKHLKWMQAGIYLSDAKLNVIFGSIRDREREEIVPNN